MGFPLIGETIQFLIPSKSLDTPRFIKKRIARHGTLFRTNLAGQRIVVSSDPEFSYFILQQEGKLVQIWYMDSFSTIIGGTSSARAAAHSYFHKYFRKLVANHFSTEKVLKEKLLPEMEVMANQSLQSWSTQVSIELKEAIASMVFNFASKLLFNYDSTKSSSNKNLNKMLANFIQGIMSFPLNIPGTAFHKCMKNQKGAVELMKEIIRERLNSPEKRYPDLLDQLIDDMKKDDFLTEELVAFMMLMLLLASFETISASLTVGLMLLTDQPLVVKELMEEQEEIIKSRENVDPLLTWKEYRSMTLMPQVINEMLRMSSVTPGILRKVMKDIHVNGYVIPEGWAIMVVPSALQMDPDKFKDPLSFNPWRWKDLEPNTIAKSFIPFGGGARNCAGAEFSKVLMSVFMHVLVTKFRWKKLKGGEAARIPILSFGNGFHVKISKKSEINENTP
ncbi:Cytochrome P450 [Macleaya cordata]|uniref:Cytochrome P450 n=1 Tax=Macleaya cordata TaxID=56857 RepID=A0A200QBU4_MACCD|nr:Cytochrome P450 [Macleaya cordata]